MSKQPSKKRGVTIRAVVQRLNRQLAKEALEVRAHAVAVLVTARSSLSTRLLAP